MHHIAAVVLKVVWKLVGMFFRSVQIISNAIQELTLILIQMVYFGLSDRNSSRQFSCLCVDCHAMLFQVLDCLSSSAAHDSEHVFGERLCHDHLI